MIIMRSFFGDGCRDVCGSRTSCSTNAASAWWGMRYFQPLCPKDVVAHRLCSLIPQDSHHANGDAVRSTRPAFVDAPRSRALSHFFAEKPGGSHRALSFREQACRAAPSLASQRIAVHFVVEERLRRVLQPFAGSGTWR